MKQPHRVVITGLGCLSPNGLGRQAFFDALGQGKSGIRAITAFDTASLNCKIAGTLPDFDALRWIARKDAPHVPRTVPMAIAAATEALEQAGIKPDELTPEQRRRCAVMLGSGGGGVTFTELQYQLYFEDQLNKTSVYAIPSNTMGTLASELSMAFDFKGFSHVISTGCTSSTDALGYAFQHIQAGRADVVVSGGVDATITPAIMAGFCQMKILATGFNETPEAGSRPFSADRNGFVLGEGAWIFVLESLAHAIARGARPVAEVLGYGATCDAYHRVRLDESGEEPARAMRLALDDAHLAAEAIDYLNLHGTSTQLNDRIETRAVKLALGKHAYRVPAGSTKSLIGHPQGASGAAGVATALCAMTTGTLPATLNLDVPDPECDLNYTAAIGRRQATETALCNCIGFGSKNSALVLRRFETSCP